MKLWWEYDPDGELRHKTEPRAPTPSVFEPEAPAQTGLLDASGTPLCRRPERIGFLK